MKNRIKMKDIILIALLTAVYFIVYMACMIPISLLGPFGHAISPGVCALFSGSILIFMNRKIGKMWEYTIFTALLMGAFALIGGGYLPWVATSVTSAIIADIIVSRNNRASIPLMAISSGIIHVGQAFGAIIPATFFLEAYREHWIKRGMDPAEMDANIKYTTGLMGLLAGVVVFVLAATGIYFGHLILRKHLEKMKLKKEASI